METKYIGEVNSAIPVKPAAPVSEGGVQWKCIISMIIILSGCILPVSGTELGLGKAILGIILVFITLPAVGSAIIHRRNIALQKILLFFLFVWGINLIAAMNNGVLLSRWVRLGFGSYIFVAIIFFVAYKGVNSINRYYLWITLLWFLFFVNYIDIYSLSTRGLEEAWDQRLLGFHPGPLVATMLLLPTLMIKNIKLRVMMISNLLLLILSASRAIYVIIIVALYYTIYSMPKGIAKRIMLMLAVSLVGITIVLLTPIYERMSQRFQGAVQLTDDSTLRRIDESRSAILAASSSWESLILGKGFGAFFISINKLSWRPGNPMRVTIEMAHNDLATRFFFSGLLGLFAQLVLFGALALTFLKALRQPGLEDYTRIRLNGSLLVLLAMVLMGFNGPILYFWNNNIYMGCAIGIGLADATEIIRKKGDDLGK